MRGAGDTEDQVRTREIRKQSNPVPRVHVRVRPGWATLQLLVLPALLVLAHSTHGDEKKARVPIILAAGWEKGSRRQRPHSATPRVGWPCRRWLPPARTTPVAPVPRLSGKARPGRPEVTGERGVGQLDRFVSVLLAGWMASISRTAASSFASSPPTPPLRFLPRAVVPGQTHKDTRNEPAGLTTASLLLLLLRSSSTTTVSSLARSLHASSFLVRVRQRGREEAR